MDLRIALYELAAQHRLYATATKKLQTLAEEPGTRGHILYLDILRNANRITRKIDGASSFGPLTVIDHFEAVG